jgi:nicotinamidase-related amidase
MRVVWGKRVAETLEDVLALPCAVLVIDMQNDAVHPDGKLAKAGNDLTYVRQIVPRCAAFLAEARRLGLKVVHIRTTTLRDGQSSSPSWLRRIERGINETQAVLEGSWGAEICDELAPIPGEPIVTKHRSSAFRATDLDQLLRSNGVRTVVVIGESTVGCVAATYLDAAYHDYYNVLIEDCCAAFDKWEHDTTIALHRKRNDVCTAEEALRIWRSLHSTDGLTVEAGRAR